MHQRPDKQCRDQHAPSPGEMKYEDRQRECVDCENDGGERASSAKQSVIACDMKPERKQRIGLEIAVEDILGIEVEVRSDVRRCDVIRQILKRWQVNEQQRPCRQHEQRQRNERN